MKRAAFFLIYCLAVINARPEETKIKASDVENVEIEKQRVIELQLFSKMSTSATNEDKDHERKTKEIMAKIDQVNKNLGYVQNKNKPQRKLYYGIFSKSEQKGPVTTADLFQSGLKGLAKIVGVDNNNSNKNSKERKIENPHSQYFLFPVLPLVPNHRSVSFVNDDKTDFEMLQRTVTQIKDIVAKVRGQNYPIFKRGNEFVIPSINPATEEAKLDQRTTSVGNGGPANSPMVIIPINDNSQEDDGKQHEQFEYEYEEVEGRENTKIITESKRSTHSPTSTALGVMEDKRDSRRRYKTPEATESSKILGIKLPSINKPPNFSPNGQKFGNGGGNSTKDVHNQIGGDKKKFWSRDNTGNGIFIQRLKVRKGGVAIAGPGGIATAGSGGTAIVGPSGVAYTQPDSVAIAGAGSKVVAVDAGINLTDLINTLQKMNRSTENEFVPRVGKVVATGPVIYYNRG